MRHFTSRLVATLALLAGGAIASAQTTWFVDAGGTPPGSGSESDPYTSIQYAIAQPSTSSGDTLLVLPGSYFERLDLLGKSLELRSQAGAAATVIDAGRTGSVVTYRSGESGALEGFTLTGGAGTYVAASNLSLGGGVYCVGSSPTITDCNLFDNATLLPPTFSTVEGLGGGVYCGANSALELSGCVVSGNDAGDGGGIYSDGAALKVIIGSITSNRALGSFLPGRGGGIAVASGGLTLLGAQITSNLALGSTSGAAAYGGGIWIEAGASAQLIGCTLSKNDAGGWSLGYGDLAGYGGGIESRTERTQVSIVATTLRDNWGNNGGGGLDGAATMDQCMIERNHGQFGGGVRARDVVMTKCVVLSNFGSVSGTYDWGGGVYAVHANDAWLQQCELASNRAWGLGGGGYGGTYVDCDIHHNRADGDGYSGSIGGGGVAEGTLIDCRVWGNRAEEYDFLSATGGGLYGGSAERCVLYDNEADDGGASEYTALLNCTVIGNRALAGSTGGALGGNVRNSIVWSNTPSNVFAPTTTVNWSDVEGGAAGTGNLDVEPSFWDESALDFHLRVGSPCIDAGDPTTFDPDGTRADLGALPFDANHCGPPVVYCTAKLNSLGCTPTIGTNGAAPSIAAGDFRVDASNVRNAKVGLLFWSRTAQAIPFLGGVGCVARPIQRTPVQASGGSSTGDDCSGSYSFPWTTAYLDAHALTLGDRVYCQFWSSDPGASADSGLTAGLEFTLCQ